MQFGLSLPNFDAHWHPRTLANLARDAELAGWDGFFIWDHSLIDPVGGIAISNPWVALAAIAMQTERVKIGTMVTPLPRRRPWNVAREAVSIDHLSGGRMVLGVGFGAPVHEEFEWFGEASDNRVRADRLDESLKIIDGLWSGEKFGFSGEHYQIKETVFLPRPLQQPRIPIWVAGNWPNRRPMRRAAAWDGYFPITDEGDVTPEMLSEMGDYIKQHRISDSPFEMIVAGRTSGVDPVADQAVLAPYEAAGVTWWIEDTAMWRYRPLFPWKGSYEWPLEEIEARIRLGPPRNQ